MSENEGHQEQAHTRVEKRDAGEVKTPQGTMTIVLIYAVATVVLWGYMYYILLRSSGYLDGLVT